MAITIVFMVGYGFGTERHENFEVNCEYFFTLILVPNFSEMFLYGTRYLRTVL
jgi:hypothetical protein